MEKVFDKSEMIEKIDNVERASKLVPPTKKDLQRIKCIGMWLDSYYTNVLNILGIISLKTDDDDHKYDDYTVNNITPDDIFGLSQCIADMLEINEEFANYCIDTYNTGSCNLNQNVVYCDSSMMSETQKESIMMAIFMNQYRFLYAQND